MAPRSWSTMDHQKFWLQHWSFEIWVWRQQLPSTLPSRIQHSQNRTGSKLNNCRPTNKYGGWQQHQRSTWQWLINMVRHLHRQGGQHVNYFLGGHSDTCTLNHRLKTTPTWVWFCQRRENKWCTTSQQLRMIPTSPRLSPWRCHGNRATCGASTFR